MCSRLSILADLLQVLDGALFILRLLGHSLPQVLLESLQPHLSLLPGVLEEVESLGQVV